MPGILRINIDRLLLVLSQSLEKLYNEMLRYPGQAFWDNIYIRLSRKEKLRNDIFFILSHFNSTRCGSLFLNIFNRFLSLRLLLEHFLCNNGSLSLINFPRLFFCNWRIIRYLLNMIYRSFNILSQRFNIRNEILCIIYNWILVQMRSFHLIEVIRKKLSELPSKIFVCKIKLVPAMRF